MLSALSTMGLDSAWLPLLVALVGLPALYVNLAMDAFKDYAELIKSLVPPAMTSLGPPDSAIARPMTEPVAAPAAPPSCLGSTSRNDTVVAAYDDILDHVRNELKIFDLDWWVVAALGVLMFAMICAASLPSPEILAKACSPSAQGNVVKAWMSLYATAFGLLIGFRLVWARLAIARGIRTYHEARMVSLQG